MTISQLELATWGLVVATTLLVVAAAIPALRSLADLRARKRELAANLVPDSHLLYDRCDGMVRDLVTARSMSEGQRQYYLSRISEDLEILARILDYASPAGIELINELYICRHLITQAKIEYERYLSLTDDSGSIRERDAAIQRATRLYSAAGSTLRIAESILPNWSRKIKGEDFISRFKRKAREREIEAEKELIEQRIGN